MTKDIFEAYVRKRNDMNPFRDSRTDEWQTAYRLSMSEFSALLKTIAYRKDPLFGIIDYTGNMDRFFKPSKTTKDCDEFARAWMLWGVHNGYNAQEMIATTLSNPFSDAHVITILERVNQHYLCNYEPFGPFGTFQRALDDMKRWERYGGGFIHAKGVYAEKQIERQRGL